MIKTQDGLFRESEESIQAGETYRESEEYRLTLIEELKVRLSETDYIACKIAEGAATREEYADKLAERQRLRDMINELRGGV